METSFTHFFKYGDMVTYNGKQYPIEAINYNGAPSYDLLIEKSATNKKQILENVSEVTLKLSTVGTLLNTINKYSTTFYHLYGHGSVVYYNGKEYIVRFLNHRNGITFYSILDPMGGMLDHSRMIDNIPETSLSDKLPSREVKKEELKKAITEVIVKHPKTFLAALCVFGAAILLESEYEG